MAEFGIHWFRRDLRINGNPALKHNLDKSQGRVLGLFCFDSKFLSRPDFSHNRFAFFLETLKTLRAGMRECGGDLLIIDQQPLAAFEKLREYFRREGKWACGLVTFNRDYEPFAVNRDARVEAGLRKAGIEVHSERDHLILEPHEIAKEGGGFYQVFTPFSRRWLEKFHSEEIQDRLKRQAGEGKPHFKLKWTDVSGPAFPFKDACEKFAMENAKSVTIPIPKAGYREALKTLEIFRPQLKTYKDQRDFPAVKGTSRLSLFIKNGAISTAKIASELGLAGARGAGAGTFLKEIVWREFYYHVLFHCPRVETEPFIEKYKTLAWPNNEKWFRRWCEGTTGFPIVDAGMRELNSTGWMHNRVRMIVASFLTKDLLIDWRWGENYFMKQLLDGDLAANNGGWQWAASTGCDPQPYFRIFNPELQQKKFDPKGEYIRRWIPELGTAKYPKPIVDHATQRVLALRLYS